MPVMAAFSTSIAGHWSTRTTRGGVTIRLQKDRFPLVLSDHAEDLEQPDTGTDRNRLVISTRILKTGILGIAVAAIVFAIAAVENPRLFLANAEFFFADTKAFLDPVSRPQEATGEATPVTQSAAVAQASPPVAVAGEAATGGEIAAPFKTADQSQTETRQPPTENLLGQFQAWAAGKDARAEVAPAQPVQDAQSQPVQDVQPQPVQDARANSRWDDRANPVQDAQAQIRPVQKHRPVRHVRHARSEIRLNQNPRAKLRREQNARVQLRPAQDVRAQDIRAQDIRAQDIRAQDIRAQDIRAQEPPVQNVRTPTFLESLGFRDIGSRQ
jgi:hypothetical protein